MTQLSTLRLFAVATLLAIGSFTTLGAQTLKQKLDAAETRAAQAERARDKALDDARVARADGDRRVAEAKLADADKILAAETSAKVAQAKLDGQMALNNAALVAADQLAKAKLETQLQAVETLKKELAAELVGRGVLEAEIKQLRAEAEKDTDAGIGFDFLKIRAKLKSGKDLHKKGAKQ